MGTPAVGSFKADFWEALSRCDVFEAFSRSAAELLAGGAAFGNVDEANCLLLRSSKEGDLPGIQQALAGGADINTRLPMYIRIRDDDDGTGEEAALEAVARANSLTPLMFASCEGHIEAVELLLTFGAKLDLCDEEGMQALHMAAQASSAECFRALLNAGANPLTRDNFDRNAMQCVPPPMPSFGPAEQKWPALLKEAGLISEMITGAVGVAEATENAWL